jgi:hypothetical protein
VRVTRYKTLTQNRAKQNVTYTFLHGIPLGWYSDSDSESEEEDEHPEEHGPEEDQEHQGLQAATLATFKSLLKRQVQKFKTAV